MALIVSPEVQVSVSPIGQSLKLQIGQILAQAMQGALDTGVHDGVERIYTPRPAVGAYSATLVINTVSFEHQEQRLWFIWVPPLSGVSQYEATMKLVFDLNLFDAQGRPVWKRTYVDNDFRLVWTTPSSDSTPLAEDIGRVTHEAAWRLAQQVAQDLREWLKSERNTPREL